MLDECFKRRQLRHVPPDVGKATQSLETAKIKLAEAKGLAKANFPSMAIVNAYSAMFHACRALLYKDGVQEKSHFCLILYVKEKYAKTGRLQLHLITIMDAFHEQRHDVFYGFGKQAAKPEDEKLALDTAEAMIRQVARLL